MTEFMQMLYENLSFLLVVLGCFVGLALLARLAEKTLCAATMKQRGARYIAICAMCAALSGLLMLLELSVFFAPSFYKLDLSELPVLICAFYAGPAAGVITEFLKVVVKLLLKGTSTAFVGEFANFVVGCAMILPAAIIYHLKKTKRVAILALVVGTVCMSVFGSAFNAFYLLPKFSQLFGMPMDAIIGMGSAVNASIQSVGTLVLFAVVPLNLLKGTLVSVLTFALYKRIERILLQRN